jgi:hypothetical protein
MNLLPHLQGKAGPVERTVFWRYKRAQIRRKAVRSGPWKYTDDSGQESLFHMARDERETNNVFDTEPAVVRSLKTKLAAWETEVRAPRLRDFPLT